MDLWIRAGRSAQARRKVLELFRDQQTSSLTRPQRLALARLCRRSGHPLGGVRLLHGLVRPKSRSPVSATSQERAEYAASLAQIGGDMEARDLLERIRPDEVPETLLFSAFARFVRWDYESAIPFLERYTALPQLDDYSRWVGMLNLGAAWVAVGKTSQAEPMLTELLARTRERNYSLIAGNCLLLLAEACIDQQKWNEARNYLRDAQYASEEVASIDALYVSKWSAILELKSLGSTRDTTALLKVVQETAQRREDWETARDCDFHLAVANRDPELLLRVCHGTPYPAYRQRIITSGISINLRAKDYLWTSPHQKSRTKATQGEIGLFTNGLKTGHVLWRLTRCLASDFYRPFRLARIHAELFPDRHFHPIHSPDVVHQAIRRLRRHLKEENLPVQIREKNGNYRLESRSPLRIPNFSSLMEDGNDHPEMLRLMSWIQTLHESGTVNQESFKRKDLERASGLSERTVAYALKTALNQGWVEVQGRGFQRFYRLTTRFDFKSLPKN